MMMKLKSGSSKGQRGQSLVELAISLTVMLLLLSGAVSFGIALFSYVAIRDAAGEGALYGSIRPYVDVDGNGQYSAGDTLNDAAICERVRNASDRPVDMSVAGGLFTCTSGVYGGGGTNSGNAIDVSAMGNGQFCEKSVGGTPNVIVVTVDYDQPVRMPFMGAITGPNIHLRAAATNTILEPRCP